MSSAQPAGPTTPPDNGGTNNDNNNNDGGGGGGGGGGGENNNNNNQNGDGNNNQNGDGNNNNQNGGNNNNNGGNNNNNGGNNNNNNGNGGNTNNGGNNNNANGNQNGNTRTTTGNSTSLSIPASAPVGSIVMLQPASSASQSYYKIASGEDITFKWNFTYVLATPKSLTVVAYCSDNNVEYKVGPTDSSSNTIPGSATQVVWNPYEWQLVPGQTPFQQATYTLKIWDERGSDVAMKGGYLSPYSGTKFGMYKPQGYTPFADWKCSTCNAAIGKLSEPAGLSIFFSLIVMIISAWGILRR